MSQQGGNGMEGGSVDKLDLLQKWAIASYDAIIPVAANFS